MTNIQKTKAAIINRRNEVIALIETALKNGEQVSYSFHKSKESLNAARDFNLVSARIGKISRAKRYLNRRFDMNIAYGKQINGENSDEFLLA